MLSSWLTTLGWSLGIGVASAALGWPLAWWVRREPRRALAWVVTPMLMPSYLAYAGWGLLRAPGTVVGDWLERAAEQGHRWAPVSAGYGLAFIGLALWAAPIAALVTAVVLRRVDGSVIESLRLDAGGRWARWSALARLSRGAVSAGALAVGLLMLGSAVPLHLAQVRTFAIDLWMALDVTPAGEQWRVWARAWPLIAIAAGAGWVVAGSAAGRDVGEVRTVVERPPARSGVTWWAAAVLALAVGVPVVLFAGSLRSAAALMRFWDVSGVATARSLGVASAVGVIAVGLTVLAAWGVSVGGVAAVVMRWVLGALTALGLVPGVLVGSAIGRTVGSWPIVGDSLAVVVAAHVARFAFVPVLMGCWVAKSEPESQRGLRRLEGGLGVWSWGRSFLPPVFGTVLATGLGTGLLSVHEIESAVQVMPPGESLPRRILEDLHYSRLEQMSAAALWLVGGGGIVAVAAGRMVGSGLLGRRTGPPGGT